MNTKDFSIFVERYNSHEMTNSEEQWFLKEMEGNDDLRREVEVRKRTDDILKKHEIMSLRSKLSTLEKSRQERVSRRFFRARAIIKYAAVFAGVALVTSLLLFNGKTLTSEEIVDHFYKSYEAPAAQRSAGIANNTDYILGLQYYNAHDYRMAASQFAKVLDKDPTDMQTHLLSGVSHMEEKLYNEAKSSFKTVIDDNNNLFIESARWYLALCYVKTDDFEKASQLLLSIKNDGGFYSKDAKKVLRKIK